MSDYRREASEVMREARWTILSALFYVLLPIVVVLGLLGGAGYLAGVGTGLFKEVVNPQNIIQNYEWFEQQVKDIKAVEIQTKFAQDQLDEFNKSVGPRDKWTFQDRDEYSRLSSIVTGLKQQRASMVATYNARAEMITRKEFKSRNLPEHIE